MDGASPVVVVLERAFTVLVFFGELGFFALVGGGVVLIVMLIHRACHRYRRRGE